MTLHRTALFLAAAQAVQSAGLQFKDGDGGPLPARLESLAAHFSDINFSLHSEDARTAIAAEIVQWANKHDHPVFYASVYPPDANGDVTVLLTDGITGTVSVEGGAHLSAERVLKSLRVKSGAPVNSRELQEELDWLQRNPFHKTSLAASPGATAAIADITFSLSNDLPVSFSFAYDNLGVPPLGETRYRSVLQWGNFMGLDQQMAVQYITGNDPGAYQALAGEWIIPLPWRHEIRFSGAWAGTGVSSDFESASLATDGQLWAAALRYVVPVRLTRNQTADIFAGFDYRRFDTDVTFGGDALFANAVEAGAFVLGINWKRLAGLKADYVSAEVSWSPGGLFHAATDDAYQRINPDADASYAILRGSWQSRRPLGEDWQQWNKAGVQLASGPLLPSEDFSIAGASTVRGYSERSVRGKHGAFLSSETVTPALPLPRAWAQQGVAWRISAFADAGWASPSYHAPDAWLAAAGIGLRARAGDSFSLSCDVAWPLREPSGSAAAGGPRVHLSAQLSF